MTLLVHGREGLEKAQTASEALYKGNIEAVGQMNVTDVVQLFEGATIVDILPQAGQSILELAMRVGCFKCESMLSPAISWLSFSLNAFIYR